MCAWPSRVGDTRPPAPGVGASAARGRSSGGGCGGSTAWGHRSSASSQAGAPQGLALLLREVWPGSIPEEIIHFISLLPVAIRMWVAAGCASDLPKVVCCRQLEAHVRQVARTVYADFGAGHGGALLPPA